MGTIANAGAAMTNYGDESNGDWRTYRCPVCSHSDGVSLAGTESVLIRCSHCDTPLEIARRSSGGSVSVTVASRPSRRQKERAS